MTKNQGFIFTKKFDEAVANVKKTDYSEIQKNLEKLAEKSLKYLKASKMKRL